MAMLMLAKADGCFFFFAADFISFIIYLFVF